MENSESQQSNAELSKMFNDYKKSQEPKRKSQENALAKYFTPRKDKEYFRILPPKNNRPFIEEAHFHVITTVVAGGKKKTEKIYCPALNNPKVPKKDAQGQFVLDANGNQVMIAQACPLCQKHRKMMATQDQSLKGVRKENFNAEQKEISEKNKQIFMEASKFEAKKFYIIRGIDKGAEKDGVKYWRFKHNFKHSGTLDKLMPILSDFVNDNDGLDFTNVQKGADLSITVIDVPMYGGTSTYRDVSAFSAKSNVLHTDPIIVRQWLEDTTTWRDIFKAKKVRGVNEYEYLVLAAEGNLPYWDESDANNKRWVFPNHPDLEIAANTRTNDYDADENYDDYDEESAPETQSQNAYKQEVNTAVNVAANVVGTQQKEVKDNDEDYGDLPF